MPKKTSGETKTDIYRVIIVSFTRSCNAPAYAAATAKGRGVAEAGTVTQRKELWCRRLKPP